MRKGIVLATLVLLLVGFNWSALNKEGLRRDGAVVLLELAPIDPRALLLGDFMVLNYRLNRTATDALRAAHPRVSADRRDLGRYPLPEDGLAVLRLNADRVASFSRLDDGSPLAPDELRVFFRVRSGEVLLAASAFFFQEGYAKDFDQARYGELRVGPNGKSLLVHLRDKDLRRIGPQEASKNKE